MSKLDEAKLGMLEALGIPTDTPIHKVVIRYDYESAIEVDVTYEVFTEREFVRYTKHLEVVEKC